jgi:hypothetical protein
MTKAMNRLIPEDLKVWVDEQGVPHLETDTEKPLSFEWNIRVVFNSPVVFNKHYEVVQDLDGNVIVRFPQFDYYLRKVD